MAIDLEHYGEKLRAEKALLEAELSHVGSMNAETPGDWVPKADDLNSPKSDPNDRADEVENLLENVGIEDQLEIQLNTVTAALARIAVGTYGICKICKGEIEGKRLEASAAATTCIEHREQE